jgi:hypothetical protein
MDFKQLQISAIYIELCFPGGDSSAVRQRSKKSAVSDSKEKVNRNGNSYKRLKFQIKPSDSIQTDFK